MANGGHPKPKEPVERKKKAAKPKPEPKGSAAPSAPNKRKGQ